LLVYQFSAVSGLFPGAVPDEGDYRHLYPTVCLSIRIFEASHTLPYAMGWTENLRYPKDRIHVQLLIQPESQLSTEIRR
jgi:hypothetical protein